MANFVTISKVSRFLSICLFLICMSCGGAGNDAEKEKEKSNIPSDFTVRIHLNGNTGPLNALLGADANSGEILDYNVHCALLEMNPDGFELRPFLAVSKPEIKVLDSDGMSITYEIREEAVWDNGTPITAEDYVFTVKAIKNPKTDAAQSRPYLEFIEDIEIDPNNPKKFTLICNRRYLHAELASGTLAVFPSYFYDPQGLMRDITIPELNNPDNFDKLKADPRIIDFAEAFNHNFNHEPDVIVGAGPYQVTEISTHQFVKLERKKEWWGDKVDVDYIAAYPEKLHFIIIDNENTSLMRLKEQELDVMNYIPDEPFLTLQKDERVVKNFNLYSVNSFSYRYIGINMKNPKLEDVRVRRALAHLVDKNHVVEELCSGLASPVNGPVSPLKKYYNKNIPELEFSIEKAKALLEEAGWADSDGDNILDKTIAGRKVPLKLKFIYPQGKPFYKSIAKILKDEAMRVGIAIDMVALEASVLLEDIKKRNFDLNCLGWSRGPQLDDFKQVWHTSSDTYEGSNSVGFGTEESDKLIDEIRETIDEAKRNEMYLKFQEMVAAEQPYIFLVAPQMSLAINKRFSNAPPTALTPGYFVRLFKLAEKEETTGS